MNCPHCNAQGAKYPLLLGKVDYPNNVTERIIAVKCDKCGIVAIAQANTVNHKTQVTISEVIKPGKPL